MITQKKITLINKVLELEFWFIGYLSEPQDAHLLMAIKRNTNSIITLIKKN